MKEISFVIQPTYKETQEDRKQRVQNDVANRSNIYVNKKKYNRKKLKNITKTLDNNI